MDIQIDRADRPHGGAELTVRGRLDADSADELRQAVAAELRRGLRGITLDLDAVTFLSSAGIRVLFETQRESRASGGDCHVRTASPPVRKVLELTRLDAILMRPMGDTAGLPQKVTAARARPPEAGSRQESRDFERRGVRFVGFASPSPQPLVGRICGTVTSVAGGPQPSERMRIGPESFALGLAAFADDAAANGMAGEVVAACGAVYRRPPKPFAAVDYLLGEGDLVPEIEVVTGLTWQGLPNGCTAFEPADDRAAVAIDELLHVVLEQGLPAATGSGPVAVVIAGEVQGLVAAELIRPLAEATPEDHPLAGTAAVAARWLCFSREPVHAGRTAVLVGVVSRTSGRELGELVAPLGPSGVPGHLHAVVFPHRPVRGASGELSTVMADLTASEPLAVVHLMADERPVLGIGVSELVRGVCWFAPLSFGGVA